MFSKPSGRRFLRSGVFGGFLRGLSEAAYGLRSATHAEFRSSPKTERSLRSFRKHFPAAGPVSRKDLSPMTWEEFYERLDQVEADYENGRIITQENLKKESENW